MAWRGSWVSSVGARRCRGWVVSRGPPGGSRAGHEHRGPARSRHRLTYLISSFAALTASDSACCADTSLNSADSTALRTRSLTSAFLGMVGTMSAYVAMMSFASGRALSSIAAEPDEKNGSSKAFGEDG